MTNFIDKKDTQQFDCDCFGRNVCDKFRKGMYYAYDQENL